MSRHASAPAVSGRRALTDGTCPLHGPSEDGYPCARFAHLRPDGRAAVRVHWLRRLSVIPRRLFKPVVIVGGVALVAWFGSQRLPLLFSSLPGAHP